MDDEATISADPNETHPDHRGGDAGSQGTLALSDEAGYVGDTITFTGRNCPPNRELEVVWRSSQGSWGILEANEVVGPQYQPRQETILTVVTDDSGRFDEDWQVQEDYGGAHAIQLQAADGTAIDSATFEIEPWFEIDRTSAQMGEAFTVTGYGIGPNAVMNNYQVAWDNGFLGVMTGVMNRGTATAEVRAVGPPGDHVIDIWRNHRGIPYLQNNTQSPYGPVGGDRTSRWTVEVTEPETDPETAWVDPLFDEAPIDIHYPNIDPDPSVEFEIDPSSGQAGTTAFITGRNFPANEAVELTWYRHEGHRVSGDPITPEPHPDVLPAVTTDENGSFQVEVDIPAEQGSTRPITAAVDGEEIAITGFMTQPDIERFEPRSGPVGTEIEIELSGIGWTIYENAQYFVYDNKPLGYACGTAGGETTGVVRVEIPATGEPGWHFIDVYPSLFDMQEDTPEFEIRPHLSYIDNHPMRPLPGLHMAFEVTED